MISLHIWLLSHESRAGASQELGSKDSFAVLLLLQYPLVYPFSLPSPTSFFILSSFPPSLPPASPHCRHAYRPEKIGTVLKICHKIKSVLPFCLILSCSEFQRSLQSFKPVCHLYYTLKKKNDIETDVIAAKVAMVDLVMELNLPLSTLDRINKVFKKSLRIQTLLKGQLKMFLFFMSAILLFCH